MLRSRKGWRVRFRSRPYVGKDYCWNEGIVGIIYKETKKRMLVGQKLDEEGSKIKRNLRFNHY